MKNLFTFIAAVLLTANVFAQAPQKMSYQAVIRNSSNALLVSTPVRMRISILQTTSTGTAVYVETQSTTTNANGLVSVEIGMGSPVTGTFAGINWSAGPYFVKTETDPTGGTSYSITGTSQLMSVPYALYAANSGNAGVPYTGATGPVDLGAYDLKVNGINVGIGSGQVNGNIAIGLTTLNSNTSGRANTAIGAEALRSNTTGSINTAYGQQALFANRTGIENTATGANTLLFNTTGSDNTASGYQALQTNTTGSANTAFGAAALITNTTGSNLTAIGTGANVTTDGLTNSTAIGYNSNVSTSNTIQLGNSSVTNVNTAGKLTTGAITYPIVTGTSGQVLTSDGLGAASWANAAVNADQLSDLLFKISNLQAQISELQNPLPRITIGAQIWSSINLDVSTYRDGTPIPQVTDQTTWNNLTTGAWCYYNNDPTNGETYGKLYNWYAVAGIYDIASLNDPSLRKQLAPTGWKIPTDTDFTTLTTFLGGENVAGLEMKETGISHWTSPNSNATNSSGFTGLPGGSRSPNNRSFDFINNYGNWWSSSENNSLTAFYRSLFYGGSYCGSATNPKSNGFSVRCIKN